MILVLYFSWTVPHPAETPYEISNRTEIPLLVSGGLLSGSSFYFLSKIKPLSQEQIQNLNPANINSFDRGACNYWNPKISDYSDYLLIGSILAPATLLGSQKIKPDYQVVGLMYFETLIVSSALNQLSKAIFKRTRPYAYNQSIPDSFKLNNINMRESYYSGHTTISFTALIFMATVYDHYHPESEYTPYIWCAAIGMASTVGLFRIYSGKHFPTDVITGAVIGGLLGYYIPKLHEKNEHQKKHKNASSMRISISVPL